MQGKALAAPAGGRRLEPIRAVGRRPVKLALNASASGIDYTIGFDGLGAHAAVVE